jgi:hypothetical protein
LRECFWFVGELLVCGNAFILRESHWCVEALLRRGYAFSL